MCIYIYICIQNITRQKQKENWQGASKSIMDMACGISQKKEQTERQFVEVPQTLPMALGMHGEKHNETYSRDLEELVNSPEVTRCVFGAKVL